MSVRASPNLLALAIVIGPVVALTNQGLVYAIGTSACGSNMRPLMHLVEALALVICIAAIAFAYGIYRRFGTEGRTRFMAVTSLGAGTFSALVIIAQWAAVFTFSPCARA